MMPWKSKLQSLFFNKTLLNTKQSLTINLYIPFLKLLIGRKGVEYIFRFSESLELLVFKLSAAKMERKDREPRVVWFFFFCACSLTA